MITNSTITVEPLRFFFFGAVVFFCAVGFAADAPAVGAETAGFAVGAAGFCAGAAGFAAGAVALGEGATGL